MGERGRSILFALCGAVLLACLAPPQPAEAAPDRDCRYQFNSQCYLTLADAEAALRTGGASRSYFYRSGTTRFIATNINGSIVGVLEHDYVLPELRAYEREPPFYRWYDYSGESTPNRETTDCGTGSRCLDEETAKNSRITDLQRSSSLCELNIVPSSGWLWRSGLVGIRGETGGGLTREHRLYQVTVGYRKIDGACVSSTDEEQVARYTPYACVEGYRYYALTGDDGATEVWCRPDTTYFPRLVEKIREIVVQKNSPCAGNPCNPATGAKTDQHVDYQGPTLRLVRYYNSVAQTLDAHAMARGWQHSYSRHLFQHSPTSCPTFIVTDNGSYVRSIYLSTGRCRLDGIPGAELRLVGDEWELRQPSGDREYYRNGVLERIVQRNGEVIRLDRSQPDTLRVVDGHGRALQLHYTDGRLDRVTTPDNTTISYGYREDAPGVRYLTSVAYPDGAQRRYFYEDATGPHLLTGIENENGQRLGTYTYADGRVTRSERAGGQWTTFVYNSDGSTTVTEAGGVTYTLHFDSARRVTGMTGGPCTTCSIRHRAISYDSRGYIAETTDFNGNITRYTRGTTGLELSRTEAADTPLARTVTTTWENGRPVRITEPRQITTISYDGNGRVLSRTVTPRP